MHICFLTHEYPKKGSVQGGIGSVVQAISHALMQKGHKVTVIGVTKHNNERLSIENDQGVIVYRIKGTQLKMANFIPNTKMLLAELKKINKDNPIDIIEGSELDFAFFPKKYFAKKIIRMHGGHQFFAYTTNGKRSGWKSFQEKLSFSKADALIAVSDFVGKTTLELLHDKREYQVIYNLVDTNKFYKSDSTKIIKNKILFIGSIVEKKGVMQLIHAMPKLYEKYKNIELILIGRDGIDYVNGGRYMGTIKKTMTDEMHKYIKFVGPKPHAELPRYIEEAEVCVYPSHMEAQGLVVVEAMSMAKAVVFSKTGPGSEMITHGFNGLLCDPYSSSDIAQQISTFLDDQEKVVKCGENARISILERFNMQNIINQNISFYKSQL